MGTVLARLRGVTAGYAGRAVLHDLSLDIVRGRQLAVLGPSGAGKSTLLKLLTRELVPLSGSVSFEGDARPREGVVGQNPDLFEWLTIRENIGLGLRLRANRDLVEGGAGEVDRLIALLQLGDVVERYPDEVSGGQAQRTALARALAISPGLLVLDEPFSALDPATRHELQQWLRSTAVAEQLTSVLVTHDLDEALVVADDIVLVSRDGRILHGWTNHFPAADATAAQTHRLRAQLRRGYDADPEFEPDDSEFSGYALPSGARHG
ncbi:ABC transporter ATP-binding protein [Aestuariimicrobium sp. Y1814]|uniref:ABC transporter ATP-binding protein n=1 Tax=Aestuariimicrobium sp. Y1814 TaxID=3418742 RepID=UPI003DA70635